MKKFIAILLANLTFACQAEPSYAIVRFPVYYDSGDDQNIVLTKDKKPAKDVVQSSKRP